MIRFASGMSLLALSLMTLSTSAQQTPPIAPKYVETPVPDPQIVPTVEPPADLPSKPLTANEAARIAVVHQPTIEQAVQAVIAAKGLTEQVRSAMLPIVAVNAQYTNVTSLHSVGGVPSTSVSGFPGYLATGELKQLLFDFEHTRGVGKAIEAP